MQKWTHDLTWKEQSALLTAIRGSDEVFNEDVRALVRWIRRVVLYDADVKGKFVHNGRILPREKVKPTFEYMTVHFVTHIMHALEIIGYKHPGFIISKQAEECYKTICEVLHCNPEDVKQMNARLKDNREEKYP